MSSNDNLDDVAASEDCDNADLDRARRVGGARSPVSELVKFKQKTDDGFRLVEGWSLNLSRGGLRAILDEAVQVGEEFEITMGDDAEPRPGKIVWVRPEKGGAIVGVSFSDNDESVPPPPDVKT